MVNKSGFEIEHKFLIEYPDEEMLSAQKGCSLIYLTQGYLKENARVRKIRNGEKEVFIKTVKEHITDLTRKETEWEISEWEYNNSLKELREGSSLINKKRYCIPYDNHILEIDIFDFWNDRAFLEIELKSEDEEFTVPDYIKVIKEVTHDKRYRNSSLAETVINENLDK